MTPRCPSAVWQLFLFFLFFKVSTGVWTTDLQNSIPVEWNHLWLRLYIYVCVCARVYICVSSHTNANKWLDACVTCFWKIPVMCFTLPLDVSEIFYEIAQEDRNVSVLSMFQESAKIILSKLAVQKLDFVGSAVIYADYFFKLQKCCSSFRTRCYISASREPCYSDI